MNIKALSKISTTLAEKLPDLELVFAEDSMVEFELPRIYEPNPVIVISVDEFAPKSNKSDITLHLEMMFDGSATPYFNKCFLLNDFDAVIDHVVASIIARDKERGNQ